MDNQQPNLSYIDKKGSTTIEKHLIKDELSRVHFNSGSAVDLLIEIKI